VLNQELHGTPDFKPVKEECEECGTEADVRQLPLRTLCNKNTRKTHNERERELVSQNEIPLVVPCKSIWNTLGAQQDIS
jgi:hypothetical protein